MTERENINEYQAFQRLQDALTEASAAARQLAFLRSDQSREWDRMAQLYEEAKSMAFQLVSAVGGGEVGKARN